MEIKTISEKKILQRNLAQFLIDEVFNTITEEDILQIMPDGKWKYKNTFLNPQLISQLRISAEGFYNSDLWRILKNEIMYLAQKKALEKSQTEEDIVASKLLIYLLDTIDNRLRAMIVERQTLKRK